VIRSKSVRTSTPNLGCLAAFFALFGLAGVFTFWLLAVRPVLKAVEARSWVESPAEIVSSAVEAHSGSKGGSTYNVAMAFDYTHLGRTYRGNHYDFETGSSSGRDAKQAIVDRFPAGARTTCWVNPKDPAEAVIDRNLGWWILWGLFPLPFLGVGLGGLVFVIAAMRGRRAPVVLGSGSGGIAPS
jgi:hypothetical protein